MLRASRTIRATAFSLLAIPLIHAPAAAEDAAAEQAAETSRFDLELAWGVRWIDLPNVQAGLSSGSVPAGATKNALGWGIDAAFGANLEQPIAGFGQSARVVARPRFLRAWGKDENNVDAYGQIPVDGSSTSNGGGANEAISELDYRRWDADLVYELSFGDESFATRARFGPSYANVDHELMFDSSPFNGFRIQDEIDTNYYGAVLGGGLTFALPRGFELDADLDVDLLAANADLDVRQSFGSSSIRVRDDERHFAARIRPQIAASYTLDVSLGCVERIVLGLETSAEWNSYVPLAEHAVLDTNVFPSHIDHGDSLVIGGNASVQVQF